MLLYRLHLCHIRLCFVIVTIYAIGLWLRYLKYEATSAGGDLSNVGKLYWRALKTLSPDLVSDFINDHTLLHNSL